MKLTARDRIFSFSSRDTIALLLTEEYRKELAKQVPTDLLFVREKTNLDHFRGKQGEMLFIPLAGSPTVILSGLGKKADLTRESVRNTSAAVAETCRKKKVKAVHVIAPEIEKLSPSETAVSIGEGLCLANYSFARYKARNGENNRLIEEAVVLTSSHDRVAGTFREIEITCGNTLLCRDLVNETSDKSNPVAIAQEAKKLSRLKGVRCTVYGRGDIEKMKMGLLSAVSRGSDYPPQLVVLKYTGNPRSKKSVAIVGKGITFDSGGLNLKPTGHIEDMRSDMSGAAVCIYTIKSAAELRLKKNIYAVIPLCENMLSGKSYRPGDVYIGYNGKSVEIGNTDAEGRLVLADAVAFAEDRLKPSCIIDIATLTGACLVCFGEIIAGLLTPEDELANLIFAAGEETGDRLWRMPLYKEYNEDIKSDIADLSNVSSGRNAGTIIGGTFIKNFVKNTPWAHIDIAGTSWYSKARGYRPKHATGYGVRLLIEAIRNYRD
ncbi:MAG: leucyl aminopeptidase [Spirochaetes bacterium]|nr:MAG: leucyl aminopeptidase [Spirochaetota bacterium]